jgi:regulator of replication initiation timing
MITPLYSNRKMAKARFFAAYAVSIGLFLFLFYLLLRPLAGGTANLASLSDQPEDRHSTIYQLLHQRMEKLDNACTKVASNRSTENLRLLQIEELSFYRGVDSIRKMVTSYPDGSREKEIAALLEAFSRAAEKQIDLAKGVIATDNDTTEAIAVKGLLLEKDDRITQLQAENQQLRLERDKAYASLQTKSAATAVVVQQVPAAATSEWKDKYEKLKSAYDKLNGSTGKYVTQANELRQSYKEVVEDNRRLLAQLQAARAGKN